jgi:hypothetical protein
MRHNDRRAVTRVEILRDKIRAEFKAQNDRKDKEKKGQP